MKEKIKLSGVPETMLQTLYARARESWGRGVIRDKKAEELIARWVTEERTALSVIRPKGGAD